MNSYTKMKKIVLFAAGLLMLAATACTKGAATAETTEAVDTTEVVVDSLAADTLVVDTVAAL